MVCAAMRHRALEGGTEHWREAQRGKERRKEGKKKTNRERERHKEETREGKKKTEIECGTKGSNNCRL